MVPRGPNAGSNTDPVSLLISSWRKQWNNNFLFYFVQLSSFGKFPNSNQGSEWAELREAQLMALHCPIQVWRLQQYWKSR
jgi:hypothetical protein